MSSAKRRWIVALLVLLLAAASWFDIATTVSKEQSEKGLTRALASYAVARGLNAVISLAQGTEIAVQPFGIGAVIAVGQFLDPVNDLIEQFSSLMLMASVAFGLQILMIKLGAHWLVAALLTVAAVAAAGAVWWRGGVPRWLRQVLLVLVIARFAVPLYAVTSEAVYEGLLQDEYATTQAGLKQGAESITRATGTELSGEPVAAAPVQADKGWWQKALPNVALPKIPDVRAIPNVITEAVNRSVKSIIDTMVLFALQTVVFPVVFLWLLMLASKSIVAAPSARRGEPMP